MKTAVIVAGCLLIQASAKDSTKKCRGLALRGGGDKGPYEAGVFDALAHHLPPEEV